MKKYGDGCNFRIDMSYIRSFNTKHFTLWPTQSVRHYVDILYAIFFNENCLILSQNSQQCISMDPNNNANADSDNGLGAKQVHVIIWTKNGLVNWLI